MRNIFIPITIFISLASCFSLAADMVFKETKTITILDAEKYGLSVSAIGKFKNYFITVRLEPRGLCDQAEINLVVFDRQNSEAVTAVPIKRVGGLFKFSLSERYVKLSRLDVDCIKGDRGANDYILNLNALPEAFPMEGG